MPDFNNAPEDYSDYDDDDDYVVPNTPLEKLVQELETSLGSRERFRVCPLCEAPLICIEDNGSAQRFICTNAHILSVNDMMLNN